jgi:hypothetical protein
LFDIVKRADLDDQPVPQLRRRFGSENWFACARRFASRHEPFPIGSDGALYNALITAPQARDPELLKKLDAVAGRVLRS